jgi:hypothetical protein
VQPLNAFRVFVCLYIKDLTMPKNSRQFVHYVMCEKAEVVSMRLVHISLTFLALDEA